VDEVSWYNMNPFQ